MASMARSLGGHNCQSANPNLPMPQPSRRRVPSISKTPQLDFPRPQREPT